MKRPNFFIIGAPKCGTTALSVYLGEHPNVFFCTPKEPHYFADDMPGHRRIAALDDFLALYAEAGDAHLAVGEGSVFYLYSPAALRNILRFDPAARVIVMLRNPADFVPSLHQQFHHALYEDEADLERAWDLQAERAAGRQLPRLCRQPELLQYGRLGKYAEHLETLYGIFPAAQVKVILFDDFIADTARIYREVLEFLHLPDDGRRDFPKVNEARAIRFGLGALIARYLPVGLRDLITRMRFIPVLKWLPALADRLLKGNRPRPPVSAEFRNRLAEYFAADVEKLGRMLGRDLSGWTRRR